MKTVADALRSAADGIDRLFAFINPIPTALRMLANVLDPKE